MSTFATVIKDEVTRLSRKEVRAQIEPLRKASVTYRHQIAELKRVVVTLEREIKALGRARKETSAPAAEQGSTRFVAKGLRTMRTRLGLSAEDLGLAGRSEWSVDKELGNQERHARQGTPIRADWLARNR